MAIDRTKFYYQEWTTGHGWRCRLEIIPAGDVATKPTTAVRIPSSIISVESDEWSFEDLPFGAWKAPTMRATVDLRHCPANLVEMLQNQVYESTVSPWTYTVTNLFILYSDRGNAALDYEDYHVEFCGGQNLQQGNKRTINNKNLKPERMTVEVWDLGMLLLQEHPVKEWAEYCYTYATPVMERSLIENYVTDSWQHISLLNVPYPTTSGTLRARLYLYPLAELFGEHLAESLRVHLSMWTRGLSFGLEPVIGMTGHVLIAAGFYEQDGTAAHTSGIALDPENIHVVGVVSNDVNPAEVSAHLGGMLVANKGGASYQEYPTMYNLLNDIAKNFWCKFRWKYERYNMSGTNDNVTLRFYWDKWQDNFDSALTGSTEFSLKKSAKPMELTDCHNVIRTGESEMPNVGEDDADKRQVSSGGVRNSATWNVKLVHNNQITYADATHGIFFNTPRIDARRLYYYYSPLPDIYRVHDRVKLIDNYAGSEFTIYEDIVAIPAGKEFGAYNNAVGETQSAETGLAYAIARRAIDKFGSPHQCELTAAFAMKADVGLLPSNCGSVLKTDIIPGEKFGQYWLLMNAKADWKTGVMECSLLSFREP